MNLIYSKNNDEHDKIIASTLKILQKNQQHRRFKIPSNDSGGSTTSISGSHPVFQCPLISIKNNTMLRDSFQTGTRNVIFGEFNQPILTHIPQETTNPISAQIIHGKSVELFLRAIHVAEAIPTDQNTNFEVRMLEIPQMHHSFLWLHGNNDYLISLSPTSNSITEMFPYKESELNPLLKTHLSLLEQYTSNI